MCTPAVTFVTYIPSVYKRNPSLTRPSFFADNRKAAGALRKQPPAWQRKEVFPMHGKANGAHPKRSNHAQDIRDQGVVLTFILALNGDYLTIPDLARTLDRKPGDFKRPDAVERAVRDLTGVGLAEIDSGRVQPTAAALRFIEIIEGGV
jgi:hypothetical protein